MKIIKIDGNGWKLMKVDETGWDDWKWMEVDESGQENLEIIPKCCSPLPPPLLLLLITPFDWRRQNIGYYEFLQNLGGGMVLELILHFVQTGKNGRKTTENYLNP